MFLVVRRLFHAVVLFVGSRAGRFRPVVLRRLLAGSTELLRRLLAGSAELLRRPFGVGRRRHLLLVHGAGRRRPVRVLRALRRRRSVRVLRVRRPVRILRVRRAVRVLRLHRRVAAVRADRGRRPVAGEHRVLGHAGERGHLTAGVETAERERTHRFGTAFRPKDDHLGKTHTEGCQRLFLNT